jgi:hypothetical protein
MPHKQWTIFVESQAPPKPRRGAPCNGCGVCCLSAPCPLGILLSWRWHGACSALRWDAVASVYRCGVLASPREVLATELSGIALWRMPWLVRALRSLAYRWISAGSGCDSSLRVDGSTIRLPGAADGTPHCSDPAGPSP